MAPGCCSRTFKAAWSRERHRVALRTYDTRSLEQVAPVKNTEVFWSFVQRLFPPAKWLANSYSNRKFRIRADKPFSDKSQRDLVDKGFKELFILQRLTCLLKALCSQVKYRCSSGSTRNVTVFVDRITIVDGMSILSNCWFATSVSPKLYKDHQIKH